MGKLTSFLYGISRTASKTASKIIDVETVLSCNPEKIAKRAARKVINRTSHKISRKINNKLFKGGTKNNGSRNNSSRK